MRQLPPWSLPPRNTPLWNLPLPSLLLQSLSLQNLTFPCRTYICGTFPAGSSLQNFSCRSCLHLQSIPLPSFFCGSCPCTTSRTPKLSFQFTGTELSEHGLGWRPCAAVFQASVSSSGARVQISIHGHEDATQSSKATNSRR